jgi:hypothetical protein
LVTRRTTSQFAPAPLPAKPAMAAALPRGVQAAVKAATATRDVDALVQLLGAHAGNAAVLRAALHALRALDAASSLCGTLPPGTVAALLDAMLAALRAQLSAADTETLCSVVLSLLRGRGTSGVAASTHLARGGAIELLVPLLRRHAGCMQHNGFALLFAVSNDAAQIAAGGGGGDGWPRALAAGALEVCVAALRNSAFSATMEDMSDHGRPRQRSSALLGRETSTTKPRVLLWRKAGRTTTARCRRWRRSRHCFKQIGTRRNSAPCGAARCLRCFR